MTKTRKAGNRGDGRGDEWWLAVSELFDENVRVYLRLSALAARMHGDGALSGPRRTVLVSLARTGPRTVAQMAREREQPRQKFQPLVNALIADGLLRAVRNPAHKQSALIDLTARGRRTVRRIHRTELAWRPRLTIDVSTARLRQANAVMRAVRAELERLIHEGEE